MSVHFKLFKTHGQSLLDIFLHWQERRSRTAAGAGVPSIQSIDMESASLLIFQPCPSGEGICGLDSMHLRHTPA